MCSRSDNWVAIFLGKLSTYCMIHLSGAASWKTSFQVNVEDDTDYVSLCYCTSWALLATWEIRPKIIAHLFNFAALVSVRPKKEYHFFMLDIVFTAHLCVDYGGHPEAFGWPGHREHGPEEDENGQDEWEQRSRHDVVEDDDKVAQHLWFGHHGVVEGEQQLQRPRQRHEELVRVGDLIIFKHAAGRMEAKDREGKKENRFD